MPGAISEAVEPDTVQTKGVFDVNVTVSPDEAVADNTNVPPCT
jgi:hypothetical protein